MAGSTPPLDGIRVLDLGRHQAGPRCAQVLARLGAEVIKIERLEGEETRAHGPWARGQSAYFVQYNSGKKSLAMDLRQEQAREILRKLVKVSDVFLQNFRPGTIDKMGFGYEVLEALNPRIIMVNVSAYGQFGPYSDRIGYDPIGQAMAGIMMVTGQEGMPPIQTGVPIIDRTTALHAAIGTLAAIVERSISGKGQTIDVCLADSGYSLTEIPITAQHGGGALPPRGAGGGAPPSGIYPCRDGWVLVSAGDQHMWPRVCRALDKPEWLDDPRFTERKIRQEHGPVIAEAVTAVLADLTMQEAIDHFTKHDITAAPVNTIPQAAADPHPWERRTMVEVPDPIAGTIAVSGDYWHFGRSEVVVGSTPTVGQHTEELLVELLGYTPGRVAELREARVIA
ncbi:MAG TPA: CoA transferase [Chloroflexota bacterium]|nr:CoA transferase [Chloroflexota bacterium]